MKGVLYSVLLFYLKCCEPKVFLKVFNIPQLLHPLDTVTSTLFHSKGLCVWTRPNVSDDVESTVNYLLQYYKRTVVIVSYETVYIRSKICFDNVLFNTDFVEINKFFNDKPPSVQNVFLVIDTESNYSSTDTYEQDRLKIFASAKVIVLQKNQMLKLTSPYFPPRLFRVINSFSMFEDREPKSLRGRNVNIATFNCSLFSIINNFSSLEANDGIEMRMLRELAYRVNFTPSFVELTGVGKWGVMMPNGSWVGGVCGALENGEADIGFCNVWSVLRYINSFDFGPQWNAVYHTFMVPRPQMVHGFWVIIMQLFNRSVWVLLLVTFLLVTLMYWKYKIPSSDGFRDINESILTVYGIFFATTSYLPSSTVRFSQQIITSWSVFSFFICSIFSNTVITRLMIPHLSTLIDSVEDIVHQNYLWGEPGYTNDSKRSIYFNIDDPWQVRLEGNYRHLTMNTSRAALHSGKFVFPVQRMGHEYIFVNVDGLNTMDFKGFRVISQDLNQCYSAFGFSRHSPLLQICYRPLLTFFESGLIQHWKNNVILRRGKGLVKFLIFEPSTESVDSFKPLTISSNLAAFRILVCGWMLATLCFVFELFIRYRSVCLKRKTQKKIVHYHFYN